MPFEKLTILLISGGVLAGYLKYYFMFRTIMQKNIERIYQLAPEKEKVCIFAFQAIQSYLLVLVMIALGIIIRSLPIDSRIIGTLFLAIGTGLYAGGYRYLFHKQNALI